MGLCLNFAFPLTIYIWQPKVAKARSTHRLCWSWWKKMETLISCIRWARKEQNVLRLVQKKVRLDCWIWQFFSVVEADWWYLVWRIIFKSAGNCPPGLIICRWFFIGRDSRKRCSYAKTLPFFIFLDSYLKSIYKTNRFSY